MDLLADASYALDAIEQPEETGAVRLPEALPGIDRNVVRAFEARVNELATHGRESVRRVDLGRGIVAVAEGQGKGGGGGGVSRRRREGELGLDDDVIANALAEGEGDAAQVRAVICGGAFSPVSHRFVFVAMG